MPEQNYYLKLNGVQGESRDRYHVGWMKLETLQWSSRVLDLRNSSGHGPPPKELWLTKLIDNASTVLAKAWREGGAFSSGVLELTDAVTKRPKVRFDFSDVEVTAYDISRAGATLMDQVTLTFASVTINFNPVVDDDALDRILKAFGLAP